MRVASRNRTLGTLGRFWFIHGFRLLHLLSIRVASLKRIRASSAEKSSVEQTILAILLYTYTVCAEMFARRNFCELLAELKFRVFIFANDCLIIYISYIAYILVLLFTLLSVQKDGGIVRFCELRARIPCVSRDLDCNGGRNADLQQGNT